MGPKNAALINAEFYYETLKRIFDAMYDTEKPLRPIADGLDCFIRDHVVDKMRRLSGALRAGEKRAAVRKLRRTTDEWIVAVWQRASLKEADGSFSNRGSIVRCAVSWYFWKRPEEKQKTPWQLTIGTTATLGWIDDGEPSSEAEPSSDGDDE